MYTAFICAAIGLIVGLTIAFTAYARQYHGPTWRFIGRPLVFAGLGLIGGAFLSMGLADAYHCTQYERWSTTGLASMNTGSSIRGSFVLGSGSINGASRYEFLMIDKDKALIPGSVPRDNRVRIYEEDRKDAQLVIWKLQVKPVYRRWFVNPDGDVYAYDFFVPKGSVVYGFKVE